jgi:hypothetical protein
VSQTSIASTTQTPTTIYDQNSSKNGTQELDKGAFHGMSIAEQLRLI